MRVQASNFSPIRATGRPFTKTLKLPPLMTPTCTGHTFGAGNKWGVVISPKAAKGSPLTNTSGLPVAITNGLQCGTPMSPNLATGFPIRFLHEL